VVEAGQRLGLELEALEESVVVDEAGEEGLEGYLSAQRLLGGAIDDGHATGAEPLVHVVVAYPSVREVVE